MQRYYLTGMRDAAFYLGLKTAASRLDREVAAGNVGYHQVDPRIPEALGPTGYGKYVSRTSANAGAEVDPATLARRRKLNEAVFRNAHARSAKANASGELQAVALSGPHDFAAAGRLENKPYPGMGPATLTAGRGVTGVYVPETSGQFIRAAPSGVTGTIGATAAAMGYPQLLPNRTPADATLNRAVLEHEIGEAMTGVRPERHMHASHFGVEPIIRENLALQGDPEAQAAMAKLRRSNTDDALVQRLSRQVGAHPDAPLAVGGRQQRALERALVRNRGQLDPAIQGKALQQQIANEMQLAPGYKEMATAQGDELRSIQRQMANARIHQATLPQEGHDIARRLGPQVHELMADVSGSGSAWDKMKGLVPQIRQMWPDIRASKRLFHR